ncbi:hypothetical protein BLNAU_12078 [Blattamonas nauphoetae]|uniref:Tc1-like transposase DDE domain-containing protein n=1 Tax=Blattamonas nauphoetae TaxID=2049346 RepID=A0ABQ9XQI2_9EUKA|nr:hypothetical protein BLNAU_12078 [Blattamonas nauphoetae]
MDGAPYHKHPDIFRAARDQLIDVVFIPPNTSRYTQPVDQSINGTFRNLLSQSIPDHISVGVANNRRDFMQAFLRVSDSALSHRSIQHSFEVCGLYPLNANAVLARVREDPPGFVELQPNQHHLLDVGRNF